MNIILKKLFDSFKSSKLAKGSSISFLTQTSGFAINYLLQIFLARVLGRSDYGGYAYSIALALSLSTFAELGLRQGSIRFIAEYNAKAEWARLRGFIERTWQMTFCSGILMACLSAWAISILNSYGYLTNISGLTVGVWLVPFITIANLQQELCRGLQFIFIAYSPRSLIQPLLISVGFFALIAANPGLKMTSELGLFITMAVYLLVSIIQNRLFQLKIPTQIYAASAQYEMREWMKVSAPLSVINVFQVVFRQSDILLVGWFLGQDPVAIYSVSARIAALISFVLLSILGIAAPMFVATYAHQNKEEMQSLVSKVAFWSFWPSLLMTIIIIALGKPILGLFGEGFDEAQLPLVILCLGHLFNSGTGAVFELLNLTGHQNESAFVFGVCAFLTVILLIIGINAYGIIGAASAVAFMQIVRNLWSHKLVVEKLGIHPSVISLLVNRPKVA